MKQYCVISHTHWDREWYQPFDLFRMRLADLIDNLLDILNKNDNYIFHLDAQTVVLEDYLEIHPKRKSELEKYISNGQIIVGPWYVQNDFYLSCGESTVRNLLIGSEIAESFGKCGTIGYCPDQFGVIGQLPQIINQFDLDGFVFGRGNTKVEKNENGLSISSSPAEFYWKGKDGTTVKSVCMVRWYNNAQRFSKDLNKAKALIKINEEGLDVVSKVPFRLMMNGVDHLEPQDDLLPILSKLNADMENAEIYQGKMDQYLHQTFDYIEKNGIDVETVEGELRNGTDDNILEGTLSSRVYLKQSNDLCENMLLHRLEPLYTMLTHEGFKKEYPRDYLHYLWKELIKNHAHDSICGCSNDIVHKEMEGRFPRIIRNTDKLIERGMKLATFHNDIENLSDNDYIITLANTTELKKNEVVTVRFNFPESENIKGFKIIDRFGNNVKFVAHKPIKRQINIYSPINLPTSVAVDSYDVKIFAENINPFAFRYLVVKPDNSISLPEVIKDTDVKEIESNNYKITLKDNGTLNLTVKSRNINIDNFLTFEDTADAGHSYNFYALKLDKAISTENTLIDSFVLTDELEQKLNLTYRLMLPCGIDGEARSNSLIAHDVKVVVSLSNVDERIHIDYSFDNKAKNHRLRMIVKTGIESEKSVAASAFETVSRKIGSVAVDDVRGADLPNAGLIALENGKDAVAVYNTGLHEYEHLTDKGDIAITVLRSTGAIIGSYAAECGDEWKTPDGQCLRKINGGVIIEYLDDVVSAVKNLSSVRNPILSYFDSTDIKKFSGGRPALQDSEVNELFYPDDKYKDVVISSDTSATLIENKNIIVTAFAEAFKGTETILRFFNVSGEKQTVNVKLPCGTANASRVYLNERIKSNLEISDDYAEFEVEPYEISTIMFY